MPGDDEAPVQPEGTQPEAPEHDETGLGLARVVARGLAGRTGGRKPQRGAPTRLPSDVRRTAADGQSGGYSGAHPDARDPQSLDANLQKLVTDAGWETDLRVHGVFGRWGALVGREVADHCQPQSFADGRLVVSADSTAWATQLTLLSGTLVHKLNQELGADTVRVIDVVPPRGPTWKKGRLRVKGRGPRDTYG